MARHALSTQSEHPWRAAVRTGVNVVISSLALLLLALPELSKFVEEVWPGSPVIAWIGGAVLFLGALSTLINRIILLPGFNDFLTRIGFGPAPKDEVAPGIQILDPRDNGLGGSAPPVD